ncbi:DUF4397 domain-containing protein [Pyxidicoccus fallax]|uniref:DUF4397 domain-containing protein n=1 Tax=Pyxidicoccus fallax TaxID=394095 RepID=A0A848LKJ8_9BACT|nr:DUF4397 domain-containing protein [Pyxidicoccus fallax]NMO18213.1 DUF4397 domain-containing protein [Pyxidicoccus fallax]NPC84813.1 DUF4397 domain-containing protein [Pyxidicoccus fallax]
MPKSFWKHRVLAAALSASMSMLVAGCGDDDDETPPPEQPAPTNNARLRVIHASPDAPAVDIYAAGQAAPLFSNVKYGDTTNYVTVPAGTYNVQIRPAGAPASSAPVYSTGPLTLSTNATVSALAAGLLGSSDNAQSFRVLPLAEGFGAPVDGRARVRIVHAGADAPTVALDVNDDGSSEVSSLERFQDTGAAGVDLPAGQSFQVGVRAGGNKVTAFTIPPLPSRGEVFVIATGQLSAKPSAANGFGLLAAGVGLVRQNPVVYALHGSPDAPPVDVFVGNSELVDDLSFGELSSPIQVPPGTYKLDVFAHAAGATRPSGNPAAADDTPALMAGERYLVVAAGFLSPASNDPADSTFELLAFADGFTPDADSLRLRVVHASPDAPVVDVSPLDGSGLVPANAAFNDVAYRQASAAAGVELPATQVTVGVAAAAASDRAPVARFAIDTSIFIGKGVFAVAAGALSPTHGENEASFRLVAVNTSTSPWSAVAIQPESH